MAALFSQESQKNRKAHGDAQQKGTIQALKIPGAAAQGTVKSDKAGDSLGNPGSPGYESFGRRKQASAPEETEAEEQTSTPQNDPQERRKEIPHLGPNFLFLAQGWEAVLLVQKKICSKAKGIFEKKEGPVSYRAQKKGSLIEQKSRGCIVNLDIESHRAQMEALAKQKKA
jgi:hypothetical protein